MCPRIDTSKDVDVVDIKSRIKYVHEKGDSDSTGIEKMYLILPSLEFLAPSVALTPPTPSL